MKSKKTIPPRPAQKFLLRFLRDDLAEEVLGDLGEKFSSDVKNKSPLRAKLNYWYQVLNYMRPFAIRKSKHQLYYPMYQSYFKIGWRNLLKNKAYAFINIGGLAGGMTVAMLIGLWIYDELSYNRYHQHYDTIGKIMRKESRGEETRVSSSHVTGLGTLLKTEYGAFFKNVVMVKQRIEERVLAAGDKKLTQQGYFMQPEGGAMFSLQMKYGRHDGLKDMRSILLSESLAKKLFGDENPVNEIVKMDAKWDLTVTGVYEDLPVNTEFNGATFFAPLNLYLDGWASLDAWDNYHMVIYAQIHPEGDFDKISSIIKDITLPHVNEETAQSKPEIFIHPMSRWHLFSQFENGINVTSERMKFVWFYATIGMFVLILACINFMNLSTARSEKRSKEVGIRKSIGSQRSQLIQQFFGESLLVAGISFVLAVVLTRVLLPSFNIISDKDITMPWGNYRYWMAGVAFTIFTGILAGIYPALYLSSFNPVKVLKGTFKAGPFAALPRKVLVVVQFTVSICLIIGTGIVYQQIQFAKNRPVGYSRERLISLRPKSPEYKGKYDALRNALRNTGVVEEIATSNYSITSTYGWNGGFSWQGKKINHSFNTIFVSHEYGKTIGWEFTDGRDFSREFPSDLSGIVINESAAKLIGLENPVGESLSWSTEWNPGGVYKILGIVKDMVKGSPFDPTDPSIIFLSENDMENLYIRLNPAVSPHLALPKIEAVFKSHIPSAPFDYKFADDEYAAKFKAEERIGTLAAIFSFLAILISCSGLFGLSAFLAEQRTKEIGIRKVLGATIQNIVSLLTGDFIILITIAFLISIPIAWFAMHAWLQNFVYRVDLEWWMFALAGVITLIIANITIGYQSLKASLTNPVNSLRSE